MTVIADGSMVWHAMQAAQTVLPRGIDVEVIDVQTIAPLDEETIGRSAEKTGRVVLVAEACRSYGPTANGGWWLWSARFDFLKGPIVRVTGRHSPIPFANSLEEGVWPGTEAGHQSCAYRGGVLIRAVGLGKTRP